MSDDNLNDNTKSDSSSGLKNNLNNENSLNLNISFSEQDGSKTRSRSDTMNISNFKSKLFARLGFFTAIDPENNSINSLSERLKMLNVHFQKKEQSINNTYELEINKVNNQIEDVQKDLTDLKSNEGNSEEDLKRLKKQRSSIYDSLVKIKDKLLAKYKELSVETEDIAKHGFVKRLNDAQQELQQIFKTRLTLAKEQYAHRLQDSKDNSEINATKAKRIREAREAAKESYDAIRQRVNEMNKIGLNWGTTFFLTAIGYIGLIASGWFFAVFVQETNLRRDDYISVLLNGIISFTESIFLKNSSWLVFIYFVLGLVGLLSLIATIVWLSEKLIVNHGELSSGHPILIVNHEGKKTYVLPTTEFSRSSFVAWMEAIPYLLVVGLSLIVIALARSSVGVNGNNSAIGGTHPGDLLTSLTGEFIGVAIALTITGLAILYISFIVEPRSLKGEKKSYLGLPIHWEIRALLLLFIVVIAAALFFEVNPNYEPQSTTIALVMFSVIVLSTGYTLGYGIKHKALLREERRYANYIDKLIKLEENLGPAPLDLSFLSDPQYQKDVKDAQRDLLDIFYLKNASLKALYSSLSHGENSVLDAIITYKGKIPFYYRFIPILNRLYRDKDDSRQWPNIRLMDNWPPELGIHVADLHEEFIATLLEYRSVSERIIETEKQVTEPSNNIKKIKELKSKLLELQDNIVKINNDHEDKCSQIVLLAQEAEVAFRDGFDLGQLYFKYSMQSENEDRYRQPISSKNRD